VKTATALTITVGLLGLGLPALSLALAAGASPTATAASPRVRTRTPDARTIVRRLERRYRSTGSFKAKFKEQITTASGVKRDREGTIEYRKPGRMRWDFAPPEQETIVSDGTTLYISQPDLNQVVETPIRTAFRSSAPAALLLGIGDLERDFSASPAPSPPTDGLIHLSLKPKSDGAQVAVGLDPATYDIATLIVTDDLGNVTALEFGDLQTNVALDDALFKFKVPEGADVVTPGSR
jgi:outer membrane lipoprotein carrier protein